MWRLKKKVREQHAASINDARESQARTEAVIAHLDSQEPEIEEIVTRLQHRERANHFGEALMLAMERRA